MPGFVIVDGGDAFGGVETFADMSPSAEADFYYSYTWEVEHILDSYTHYNKPLIYLKDATLPTFTVNKEIVQGASLEYKFGKSVSWDDVKFTWYDSSGLLKIIQEWRRSVWTPEGGINPGGVYKKLSRLSSYLSGYTEANRWTLINSWPSTIRYGDLTYTASDIKIVEVTLTYDWAEDNPSVLTDGPVFAANSGLMGQPFGGDLGNIVNNSNSNNQLAP